MRNTVIAGVTALAVAGAVLVTAPAAEAAGRGTTKLHGTKSHTVSVAKTLRPGVVHFRNTGKTSVLIVRKKKAGTAALAKTLNSTSTKAERKLLRSFDFVEVAYPKSDSWVKLKKGTYFVVDAGGGKFKAANIRTVTVKGKKQNAKAPRAKTITFDKSGRIPASTTITRKSAVRLVNKSKALGFVITMKVKSSLTDAQLKQIVAHPTDDNVFGAASSGYGIDTLPIAVGPKHTSTATTKLAAGRYLLLSGFEDDTVHPGDVGLLTVR